MMTLRPANEDDSGSLWSWRNDPETRSASLDDAHVPWEDHERWFAAAMKDPARTILIAMGDAGVRIGMVRFDFDSAASATVSINVAPERRGHGVGRTLLHQALTWISENAPGTAVTAVVRSDNVASRRIFEHEGFVFVSQASDFATLTKTVDSTRT